MTITEIKIFDNAGNLKTVQKPGRSRESIINLNGYKTGVYTIEITDGKYKERQQVIIRE